MIYTKICLCPHHLIIIAFARFIIIHELKVSPFYLNVVCVEHLII